MESPFSNFFERFKSPIVANFILSWLTFNWKIPYTTFFLDQEHTGFENKLKAIENILQNTPLTTLIGFPLLATSFFVFVMPGLNYLAELFPAYLKFLKRKNEILHENELTNEKSISNTLQKKLNTIEHNGRNEFIKRAFFEKENINNLFEGQWKIVINNKDNSAIEFKMCYMQNNTFFASQEKTNILTIETIGVKKDNHNNANLIAVCRLEKNGRLKEYFVDVKGRGEIILTDRERIVTIHLDLMHIEEYMNRIQVAPELKPRIDEELLYEAEQ